MDPQHTTIWEWLALHRSPQPPDSATAPSPELLAAYLAGVEARLQRLALVVEAMRETLEAAGLVDQAQVLAKVAEIDLRDGSADGRHAPATALRCGQCGRVNGANRSRCLYCGSADLQPQPASG
jgi:hypothetical protein